MNQGRSSFSVLISFLKGFRKLKSLKYDSSSLIKFWDRRSIMMLEMALFKDLGIKSDFKTSAYQWKKAWGYQIVP